MAGILYERSWLIFVFLTIALGGAAGWLSGRAIALTWRPWWAILPAALLLGVAIRFLHYALFGEPLLALHYYAVDAVCIVLFASAGYHLTRSRQMARQYGFLVGKPMS